MYIYEDEGQSIGTTECSQVEGRHGLVCAHKTQSTQGATSPSKGWFLCPNMLPVADVGVSPLYRSLLYPVSHAGEKKHRRTMPNGRVRATATTVPSLVALTTRTLGHYKHMQCCSLPTEEKNEKRFQRESGGLWKPRQCGANTQKYSIRQPTTDNRPPLSRLTSTVGENNRNRSGDEEIPSEVCGMGPGVW